MDTISSFLTSDHRQCDNKFATLENIVLSENWEESSVKLDQFISDMEHHFDMEEKVLFPAFEEKTGMTQGPTKVMVMEHNQMRQVMGQLREDIEKKDKNHFFGVSETLMMLMQQHNMKEEQMLYAMADAHLSDEIDNIVNEMKVL